MFVDASALTAMIVGEPEAEPLLDRLAEAPRLVSGVALWETAVAVARIKQVDVTVAWTEVERFAASLGLATAPIGAPEAAAAVMAQHRYGRGNHPARLNMGDCFAYACARTNNARLLYKGDDFARTDLAWADRA